MALARVVQCCRGDDPWESAKRLRIFKLFRQGVLQEAGQ